MTPNEFLHLRTLKMAEHIQNLEIENERQKKHIKVLSAINSLFDLIEKLKQTPAIYQIAC